MVTNIVAGAVWALAIAVIGKLFWDMRHEELPSLTERAVQGHLRPHTGHLDISTRTLPFTREMVAERALEAELETEIKKGQEEVWAYHLIDNALEGYDAEDADMWPKGPGWTGEQGL